MPERPSSSSPRSAIRLTFAYDGPEVRLVDRQHVETIVPPGEPEPIPDGASGFWIEVRDKGGGALYQRSLHQPVRMEAEVFPEHHDQLPYYVPRSSPTGAFAIVVPDLPEAERAALHSSPPHPERAHEAAAEVLEVPLRGRRPPRPGGRS
jgi:hypothetical protein